LLCFLHLLHLAITVPQLGQGNLVPPTPVSAVPHDMHFSGISSFMLSPPWLMYFSV